MRSSLRRLSAIIGIPVLAGSVTLTAASSAYAGPTERAVVVLTGDSAPSGPGVRVISHLDSLNLALVEGTAEGLRLLARTPGVAGITPDAPIKFMSTDADDDPWAELDAIAKADAKAVDKAERAVDKAQRAVEKAEKAVNKARGNTAKAVANLAAARSAYEEATQTLVAATAKAADSKANAEKREAVYAWEGLGGNAGKAGAGAGVDIALIDTGVSDTPSLNRSSGRLIDAIDTSALLGEGLPSETGTFSDGFGHGTFMGNLIAGATLEDSNRSLGVAPAARVHVVKVADDDGNASLLSVIAGLSWVAAQPGTIEVANLSLGTDRPMDGYGPDPLNVAAEWLRLAGVSVVIAAGNTPGVVADPGFTPGALTVGAADTTRRQPRVAPFSGSAIVAGISKPDVVAPGVSVVSSMPSTSKIALDNPQSRLENGLYRGSGTSQATAVVTGLAALFIDANPGASTTEVKSSLRAGAGSLADERAGVGLVTASTRMSEAAGDGVVGFDPEEWRSAAYSGNGFTPEDWLAELSEAWFGDAAVGAEWSADHWQGAKWYAGKWYGAKWYAGKWYGGKWYGAKWYGAKWYGAKWYGAKWYGAKWYGAKWYGAKWYGAKWYADAWTMRAGVEA